MPWPDDLKKIEELFHQKLRTDATFEWLYLKTIEDASNSSEPLQDLVDGLTQLGKHVMLHAQYLIAKKLFEKTLELTETKIGLADIRSGKLSSNIAHCLMVQGRFNEALAILERWLSAVEGQINCSQYDYREIKTHYAEILYRSGRHEDARQVSKDVLMLTPEKDPLHAALIEKLARYETPCPTCFDPADSEENQMLSEEMLHGSPASLESLRQAVLEVVIKQALAGAPWQELCRGPMEINGITVAEVEAEINRRQAQAQSSDRS